MEPKLMRRKIKKAKVSVAAIEPVDSVEVIKIGARMVPVLGVANCTGKPLEEARKTAKRIRSFLNEIR